MWTGMNIKTLLYWPVFQLALQNGECWMVRNWLGYQSCALSLGQSVLFCFLGPDGSSFSHTSWILRITEETQEEILEFKKIQKLNWSQEFTLLFTSLVLFSGWKIALDALHRISFFFQSSLTFLDVRFRFPHGADAPNRRVRERDGSADMSHFSGTRGFNLFSILYNL
jgi:hypothetical protein